MPFRENALAEVQAAQGSECLKIVRDCPVSSIRPDGTDIYMSDISLGRYLGDEPLDAEMPGWEKLSKGENAVLEVGDPMIMWTIGGKSCSARLKMPHWICSDY